MSVLKRRGCDRKVWCKVSNPLRIWQHVISGGADHIQAEDQYLGSHKQHGHGPGDPKATQLCRSGANTIIANLTVSSQLGTLNPKPFLAQATPSSFQASSSVQELARSVQHEDSCIDVVLPPFLLGLGMTVTPYLVLHRHLHLHYLLHFTQTNAGAAL